ncbi:MAG TPA: PilZ domain-containing protein [Myxococcota bacterium]
MEKRKLQRQRKRLTCELVVGVERHAALVRDLSPHGLFVQTRARLEPGTEVLVLFAAGEQQPELRLLARVARRRESPPRLQASVPGGLGLELVDAPPAFLELAARRAEQPEDASGGTDVAPPAGAAVVRTFRVRVAPRDKPGSRVITVRSESLHGARARALAQAGRGWKIQDIQEI